MKKITDKATDNSLEIVDTEVAVSIPDRQVTDKDTIEAMKRSGNVVVGEHYLQDLETIGITLKIQRGRAMINQRRMELVLEKVAETITNTKVKSSKDDRAGAGEILMNPRDFATTVQSFAQLSSKLTESQQFSVGCEEVYRPAASPQDPDQVNNSFVPGAPVKPGTTQIFTKETHIHGAPQAEPTKENS
jgi:hypothetical protein